MLPEAPLVFAVLALAIRLSPDGPSAGGRKASEKLFWAAQIAVPFSMSLKVDSLGLVETRLLVSFLFLVLVSNIGCRGGGKPIPQSMTRRDNIFAESGKHFPTYSRASDGSVPIASGRLTAKRKVTDGA